MNSFIETLNQWGGNFLNFAWPMLWQSSLLIVVLSSRWIFCSGAKSALPSVMRFGWWCW